VNVVAGSGNRQFDVTFATQTTPGTYTLVLGPNILDRTGNPMNQDGDGTNGENPQDRYTASFTFAEAVARFDFGTATSPVAPGYTRITHTTRYDAAVGYGWLNLSAYSLDRGNGTDLTRDFNYTFAATFLVDLPAGIYDVILTLGDTGAAHDQMGVFLEGVLADSVTTAGGQTVTNTYRVTVTDGQLTLLLDDLGGSDPYVMINAMGIVAVGSESNGPRVVQATPGGTVSGPVDRIVLTFNETIQDGTFTLADVVSLTGPGGAIAPTAVNKLSGNRYEVVFAPQNAIGSYSLTLGPDITDVVGNPMDQDGDGTNGEVPSDRFTTGFTLTAFLARFDFGTATSPVAAGYTRMTHTTRYDAALSYGWQSLTAYSLDRGIGSDLTRDFNYTFVATFLINVPNGTYDVTVTMGDAGGAHDQMGVFLEGVQVGSVTTAVGQFITNTYRVTVADGQLTLLLDDLGGSDPHVMINALEVAAVAGGMSPQQANAGPTLLDPDFVLLLNGGDALAMETMGRSDATTGTEEPVDSPEVPLVVRSVRKLGPTADWSRVTNAAVRSQDQLPSVEETGNEMVNLVPWPGSL
jgi:fibronectin type 3 domain-containing protein